MHERLTGVVIERLQWDAFIRRYDREGTLFYLDPPYFGNETDYGNGVFAPADFERMAELLAGIRGRFLLSINDTPEVRTIFRRFQMQEVEATYTLAGNDIGNAMKARELVISN